MASRDYEEFIAALNAHGVRYLVVGAHAVAFHARPRATKDLDILVDPTSANARRVLAALRDFFGGAELGYAPEDVTDPRWIIQLGVAPVRIDLLSEIAGFPDFASVWRRRIEARFGSEPAHYLGIEDLISAKKAAGRPQDRADLRVLRHAKDRERPSKRSSRRRPRRPSD